MHGYSRSISNDAVTVDSRMVLEGNVRIKMMAINDQSHRPNSRTGFDAADPLSGALRLRVLLSGGVVATLPS